ncbi:MAG: B12-binding domain-containing radical SAM protein [Deltaproteobacteria bacterium]|nr:B12-binding domain-containing radical SAM protein [Deltaproteobacteria bacterium]MBW1929669.1 B12-binding domain-containing radical SAM protein [Deltaproteobacteria bacterium]MBW2025256.1 B12-binding domain-containing radical SAM protein [Deltaproteobacteria bacterium]MBW2125160.1 B12-binding domain-containing radical SAM protein [Deltaproteobacteria bacterium]RLB15640.1 MAG: radical SAM protein [Deltaproteobacteria bacterium]
MRYEGPIYRPPSEADSLLIQATVGCPHNKCTFCMVYKKGPPFRVRPVREIKEDLDEAKRIYGDTIKTLFFPAGNTIAMPTHELAEICAYAHRVFPGLKRITVYGSSKYIHQKGLQNLIRLKESGLTRIHVGLESGDDEVLRRIKKGTTASQQIEAGLWVKEAGIELSEYVILGIGGVERSEHHAVATARALNAIDPDFIRFRTFLPKINTLLLHEIRKGRFQVLSPHQVLKETQRIVENLEVTSEIHSDHYTNYIDVSGKMPKDKERMLIQIRQALEWNEDRFRPVYVGTE